jgi:hypothetical protein
MNPNLNYVEFHSKKIMPNPRWTLEASGVLEPRRSALEDDFEEEEEDKEDDDDDAQPMDINDHPKVLPPHFPFLQNECCLFYIRLSVA